MNFAAHYFCFLSLSMSVGFLGADIRYDAFSMRDEAASFQSLQRPHFDISSGGNGDEGSFDFFASSYTKSFEHDSATGLLTNNGINNGYKRLLKALESRKQEDFNAIELAFPDSRKLTNPQAALMESMQGCSAQLFSGYKPPKITSAQAAADLIEVYLLAVCRHVHFDDYGTGLASDNDGNGDSLTLRSIRILNDLGVAFTGPRDPETGIITPRVLFRGASYGNLFGYYISQFLLHDVPVLYSKNSTPNNTKMPIMIQKASMHEFGVKWEDFISLQNGLIPSNYSSADFGSMEHVVAGRSLATIVHNDGPIELFYNAAQILFGYGFPLSKDLPYQDGSITNEAAFVSMGVVEVFSALGAIGGEALKAAWAQKWLAHRSFRPEAFGGLVHLLKTSGGDNQFNLHYSLFSDNFLNFIKEHNRKQSGNDVAPGDRLTQSQASTYLLSQMYPETSPTHPAFPAGHAVIAGACTTILKAYFEGTTPIRSKIPLVKPNPNNPQELIEFASADADKMTVNSELDKLASNVAIGRNFAGIHFRPDGDLGALLGEFVAICWLQDQARIHNENTFKGFTLTKRDGTKIRITKDAIIPFA